MSVAREKIKFAKVTRESYTSLYYKLRGKNYTPENFYVEQFSIAYLIILCILE